MRKSAKGLIAALVLLFAAPLSAGDFDWSQFWCNYGGGIEKGDLIVNVDAGLEFGLFGYGSWFIPPIMAELQIAQPIWKLPFTFGGYAGISGHGWAYDSGGVFIVKFGGEAAYHVMLPPEKLDLYLSLKLGGDLWLGDLYGFSPFWFSWGTALGATWYFTDLIGVNLEVGYPMIKAGVSLKF